MKVFLLSLVIFFLLSCDRRFYNDTIAVEQHSWQLIKVDTFFRGTFRPSAIWYDTVTRLSYVDNYHEFPYPYSVGTYLSNFNIK